MGKKVQICHVVNRNEDFFDHFCINFVPWWCKHTIFLGYTNYPYMNLDYKNPETLLDMRTTLSFVYTYIFLMLFLLCLHPSCTVNLVYHPDLQWPLRTRLAEYPA